MTGGFRDPVVFLRLDAALFSIAVPHEHHLDTVGNALLPTVTFLLLLRLPRRNVAVHWILHRCQEGCQSREGYLRLGLERGEHMLGQNLGAVIVVFPAVLDERPPVDVAHVRDQGVSFLDSENVEAADLLLEDQHNPSRDLLLPEREYHREPHLLPVLVPLHLPVHRGALPRLRVAVVRTHSVHLDVRALRLYEFLVDVGPVPPDVVDLRVEFRGAVLHLPK
mmetsp:Transcript_56610/g.120195  ORF Transcript_56610/g.120195 Transcript_56610/m.120195 type:complete len:222 (-) Transcript_56610:2205-2870(-)